MNPPSLKFLPAEVLAVAASAATQAVAAAEAAHLAVQQVQQFHAMGGAGSAKTTKGPARQRFADVSLPVAHKDGERRLPAYIQWRRVHFHCPACRRFTVLPVAHCGKLVSCPKCYTGIRVPDPRRQMPAVNLGRTPAPLCHPDRFSHCVDTRRIVPWLIGRLPGASQLLAVAGIIILMTGTSAITPLSVEWATKDRTLSSPAPAPLFKEGRNFATEAEEAVLQFLAAPTPAAKAQWVIDPEKTLPLMNSWYAGKSNAGAESDALLGASTQGYYATPGASVTVSEVPVTLPGSSPRTYLVEHRPEGARIAWAESVGYSPISWRDLIFAKPVRQEPVRMRLLACQDDYWNYAFTAESLYQCVRLHDPETLEELGFGYLKRTPGRNESLASVLPGAAGGLLHPVTVMVLPHEHSARTRQVSLMAPVQPGWGAPGAMGQTHLQDVASKAGPVVPDQVPDGI